jgi:hypothetical protein
MPSLNTGNAILSNPIKVDSSYNVGIGGAASGSFKLQVTGTTNLTGALTGTSGTFSGALEAGKLGGAVIVGDLFVDSANNSVYVGRQSSTSGDNSKFYVRNRVNTLTALSVDPGGNGAVDVVGTFSTTRGTNLATATGDVGIGNATPATKLDVTGTIRPIGQTDPTSGVGMELFYRSADTSSYIQSYDRTNDVWKDVRIYGNALYFGSQGTNNLTITSGGDVAIGDTTASSRLWVRRTDDGNTFGVRATNASYGATIGFFGADRNTTNNSFYYIDCYNYGSSSYRFRVADSGAVTSASSIAAGDSVSLLGELYWGPFSSGQKVRAYPTGSSGSATLNYSFWNGSAWGIQGSLTSAGVWSTTGGGTSDARTKEEIDYNFDNGIESILKLQPTKFKFKIAPNKQRRGFIAQDVLEVIPDLVLGDGEKEDGTYGLDYDGILALAVKAIQELNQTVQNQQQQINSLINR